MRRTRVAGTVAAIVTGFVLAACTPVVAQEVGNRVRVTIGGDVLSGDVIETTDAGFTLALSEEEFREVLNRDVERLEVRTCCPEFLWAAVTVVGAAVGGSVEASLRGVECSPIVDLSGHESGCSFSPGDVVLGSIAGGVAGLVVGMTYLRDMWSTVPIPKPDGLEVGPLVDMRSGPGNPHVILGARVRF